MENVDIVSTLAVAFFAAWVFGLIAHRIGLSPMVGYLAAGFFIGPNFTPAGDLAFLNYVGDQNLAEQLAGIGVIFLMFGVGLHFNFQDLYKVRWVAIPGAIINSTLTTIIASFVFSYLGLDTNSAIVLGMSIAVASTVVLIRVLQASGKLATHSGHIAVGWLIVEDLIAVVLLILLPIIAGSDHLTPGETEIPSIWKSIGMAFLNIAILVAIMAFSGSKFAPKLLTRVSKMRSREMFTLTILVFSITLAAAASYYFEVSPALGAFLAGMIVGQTSAAYQAASDTLTLQDTFAVLFFVAVGMLLDPGAVRENPYIFFGALGVIILIKPIIIFSLIMLFGQSFKTALTVSLGMTQIGEFSFILAATALSEKLINDAAYTSIVATAIVCIIVNPFIFRYAEPIEQTLKKHEKIWNFLNRKALKRMARQNAASIASVKMFDSTNEQLAIVVGFGVVGQGVCNLLRKSGLKTVVIDSNMGTVARINESNSNSDFAIFGDATDPNILEQAGLAKAKYLLITMALSTSPIAIISLARELNPKIKILVRGRYVGERALLVSKGANQVVFDEAETAIAMGKMVVDELKDETKNFDEEMQLIRELVAR